MMNAPSHSEHHMHPDRPYDRLDTRADVPMLPHALPVMAVIAMLPKVWRRMMDRRAQKVMDAARALGPSRSLDRDARPSGQIAKELPRHPARA
jgi:alkane 1-monooxygenase